MDNKDNITGKMLRARREQLDLSQQDVADYVGVSKSAVSRWESGEISNIGLSRIKLLSEVLNIEPISIVLGYIETDVEDQEELSTSEFEEYFKNNKDKLKSLSTDKKDKLIKLIDLYLD